MHRFTRLLREAMPAGCELRLSIQTNGVLLDEAFCELFLAEGIKVGISLDGGRMPTTATAATSAGAAATRPWSGRCGSSTSPGTGRSSQDSCARSTPRTTRSGTEALLALDPPAIDFLSPRHVGRPARPPRLPAGGPATPYADWLLAIHERWRSEAAPVRVRTFDAIGRLAAGGGSLTESLGLDDTDLLVIETDGAIEQAGLAEDRLRRRSRHRPNVSGPRLDEAGAHPGVSPGRAARRRQLAPRAGACPVVDVCGGGLYAHRYRPAAVRQPFGLLRRPVPAGRRGPAPATGRGSPLVTHT